MTPEENEHRLTVLEQKQESQEQLNEELHDLLKKFAKYETRWGLVAMIAAALWAVFIAGKATIFSWFGAHS